MIHRRWHTHDEMQTIINRIVLCAQARCVAKKELAITDAVMK